jgi:hypothetical protein
LAKRNTIAGLAERHRAIFRQENWYLIFELIVEWTKNENMANFMKEITSLALLKKKQVCCWLEPIKWKLIRLAGKWEPSYFSWHNKSPFGRIGTEPMINNIIGITNRN